MSGNTYLRGAAKPKDGGQYSPVKVNQLQATATSSHQL